jgi:glutaminase
MEQERKDQEQIQKLLVDLYDKYKTLQEGEIATYIPELGKANPNSFGICLATVDGRVFKVGDCDQNFTIQSISKPLVFGMALEQCGREELFKRVGVEPSGDAFNSIILDDKTMRPYNAMVNSGAIATSALIKGHSQTASLEYLLKKLSAAAGRPLSVDQSVFESERRTGHRNRAIGHLMLNFEMIDGNVDEILDLYFQQCSVLVNCRDLAVMAATLANVGKNPLTKEWVFDTGYIKDILSVMFTCGMYDFSGEWAYRVGMPAKSGVGGGIMAVVNRQLGIGVFSPLLDSRGNSCRGTRVCIDLADELGLHVFDVMNYGSNFLKTLLEPTT